MKKAICYESVDGDFTVYTNTHGITTYHSTHNTYLLAMKEGEGCLRMGMASIVEVHTPYGMATLTLTAFNATEPYKRRKLVINGIVSN